MQNCTYYRNPFIISIVITINIMNLRSTDDSLVDANDDIESIVELVAVITSDSVVVGVVDSDIVVDVLAIMFVCLFVSNRRETRKYQPYCNKKRRVRLLVWLLLCAAVACTQINLPSFCCWHIKFARAQLYLNIFQAI